MAGPRLLPVTPHDIASSELPLAARRSSLRDLPIRTVIVSVVVFAYVLFVRTRGITQVFWLLGDQILYWRIALVPWRELPIGGGPTSVGGTTLGPAFLWGLWLIRHLIGPWTDNLPHAGGIGLSIMQSAADVVLLLAIWRRFQSLALALAVTIFLATAPYDVALTATIWNPPPAVALAKIVIAIVLVSGRESSLRRTALVVGLAMLAVQSHSSALFFTVPAVAAFTVRELFERRWTGALRHAATTAGVILLVETPYLVNRLLHADQIVRPVVVTNGVQYAVTHPSALRPLASFTAMADAFAFILLRPWTFAWFWAVLVIAAAVTVYRMRHSMAVVCVTVAPMVCTVVGYAFWMRAYDYYWYLVLAPSAATTIAIAVTAWRPAATTISACLLVAVLAAQPARLADSMTIHRLPEYGALVRGSREIRRRAPEIRAIRTEFPLPATADPTFLYEVLGGRITRQAGFVATIRRSGEVVFARVPAAPDAPRTP
jgi:hypothetical protein